MTQHQQLMQTLFRHAATTMSHELRTERAYWQAAYARHERQAQQKQARHFATMANYCMSAVYHERVQEIINSL